jgi:hypothetical protein
LADAGEFEVQAINAAGKAVSSAHAEVDQAPRIVQGLVPAEIDEGDEHLFRVEASAPIRTGKKEGNLAIMWNIFSKMVQKWRRNQGTARCKDQTERCFTEEI